MSSYDPKPTVCKCGDEIKWQGGGCGGSIVQDAGYCPSCNRTVEVWDAVSLFKPFSTEIHWYEAKKYLQCECGNQYFAQKYPREWVKCIVCLKEIDMRGK